MLSIQKVLKNTRAAIDLASIMVGIIVIGIVGAIIAATVFAVIPWAQDKAAASVMDSIETAETAYYGFSADPDSELEEGFTDKQGLIAFVEQGNNSEGLLPESNLYDVRAGVSTSGSAACWGAVVFSDSGKYYYSSSTSSTGAFSDTFLAAQQAVQTRCDVTLQQPSPDPVADNCEAPFNTSDVFSDVVDESGINCGLDTPVYLTNGGVSSSVGNVAATVCRRLHRVQHSCSLHSNR